jgi:hypothetical protein
MNDIILIHSILSVYNRLTWFTVKIYTKKCIVNLVIQNSTFKKTKRSYYQINEQQVYSVYSVYSVLII